MVGVRDASLATELIEMAVADQATRTRLAATTEFWHGYHPEMRLVHRQNGDRLDEILRDRGRWPGYDDVGPDGSEAAWIVAIHDIANPALMRRARDLMTIAVDAGQASAVELGHMVDRIRAFEGLRQLYGTQRGWDDDGRAAVWPPVDDPELADQRRRDLGLLPLAEAVADRVPEPTAPAQLSRQELLERRRRERAFIESVGWRAPTT